MSDRVVAVLTFKSVDTVLALGGTQSWALDRNRALDCKYVVMYRNARTRVPEGPEAHGMPFMVGKVSDVVPSTETPGRWLIKISDYAIPESSDEWTGRNPVAYWTIDDFDFDFDALDFLPVSPVSHDTWVEPLTIGQAKAGLARSLGVSIEQIEITVRA